MPSPSLPWPGFYYCHDRSLTSLIVITDLLYSASWKTFRTEAWMGRPPASMAALVALMTLLMVSWFLASEIFSKQVASFISQF